MNMEDRLEALERTVAHWQRICAVLAVLVIGGWILGAAQQVQQTRQANDWSKRVAPGNNAEFDVVTAKMIRVVSPIGTPVVNLTATAHQAGLIAMAAGADKPTVIISADEKQRGYLTLIGDDKDRTVELKSDAQGNGLLLLGAADGKPVLEASAARRGVEVVRVRGEGDEFAPLASPRPAAPAP